jgi:hypothetical protein
MGVSAGMGGSVGKIGWKLGRGAGRGGEGVTVPAGELGMGDGRGCGDGRELEGMEVGEIGRSWERVNDIGQPHLICYVGDHPKCAIAQCAWSP